MTDKTIYAMKAEPEDLTEAYYENIPVVNIIKDVYRFEKGVKIKIVKEIEE